LFYFLVACWCALLIPVDRFYFKHNASFSIRFLYPCIPNQPQWDIAALTEKENERLDDILAQDFTYMSKGTHCYAFASADGKYIIKFHRYPSHMRLFPWLNRPFAYLFDEKRMKIKQHNLSKYAYIMSNYKTAFKDLREETGVLLVHINRTKNLCKSISLIDKTKNRYRVPLDDVTFILQRKAELIFPTLERYVLEQQKEKVKQTITQIMELIARSCQKGYINNDPVLKRNYGLLGDRAIYIDIGDLVRKEEINHTEHLLETTYALRIWIEKHIPELLSYFEAEVKRLNGAETL
jgi:hypothetical protein